MLKLYAGGIAAKALHETKSQSQLLLRFPAHDELGMCRTSLVSQEQSIPSMSITVRSGMSMYELIYRPMYRTE